MVNACFNVGNYASPMDPMGKMFIMMYIFFLIHIYSYLDWGMPGRCHSEKLIITSLVEALYQTS